MSKIKLGTEEYTLQNRKIKDVIFNNGDNITKVHIKYVASRFTEYAIKFPYKENKPDSKLMSEIYVSIMALNSQMMEGK